MSEITLTAKSENVPLPVTDEMAQHVVKGLSDYKDKASTYWEAVAQAIHELNARAARRRAGRR